MDALGLEGMQQGLDALQHELSGLAPEELARAHMTEGAPDSVGRRGVCGVFRHSPPPAPPRSTCWCITDCAVLGRRLRL